MNEPRWYDSAEEYRTIQGLVRQGKYREALERAQGTLRAGRLSRKQAARLHSLICWVYTEELHQTSPVAMLHGEEAVRLATLLGDAWLKCEALSRLVSVYCRLGDTVRARAAVATIAAEVTLNEGALSGGVAAMYLLQARVAAAEGNEAESLNALLKAEKAADSSSAEIKDKIRLQQMGLLIEQERFTEARQLLELSTPPDQSTALEWEMVRAWLALTEPQAVPAEANHLARQAMEHMLTAGRVDLAHRFRRRLEPIR